jgi:uncharacterized protein YjcR
MNNEVYQEMQEYLKAHHNDFFNSDYSDKVKNEVNQKLFELFKDKLTDVKDVKNAISKQKGIYLRPLKQNSDITNKDELTDVKDSEVIKTEAPHDKEVKTDVNNLETLVNNQIIKNIMDLLQKQQNEIDSIKELLKQKSDVKDSEAPHDIELNTILNKIKRFDMTSNDRQTFYITETNSRLINDFYKTNQINKSSLVNFIISSWFENNVK